VTTWAVIVAVGLGSYALRALPLLLDGRWSGSARFERAIAHAGTAGLAALVAGGLRHSATSPAEALALAVAVAVGVVVAVRGGVMVRVLLAGGVAYGVVLVAAAVTT